MKKLILISLLVLFTAVVLGAREGPAVFDEQTALDNPYFYLEKAREYYGLARETYDTGEYDLSVEYSKKARDYAGMYRKAIRLAADYKLSERLIREATELIAEAVKLGASESNLAPSNDKLKEANEYFGQKNYELAANSAQESINLTKALINHLRELLTSPEKKIYKVRLIPERRDCLWRIAEYNFIYSDPWKWPMIYKANKDKILDPDLIFPGQELDIPVIPGMSADGK